MTSEERKEKVQSIQDAFVEKWLGPSGLVTIIAAIIWLIQLNVGFVQNSKTLERISTTMDTHEELVNGMLRTQERVNQVLIHLERRQTKAEAYIKEDDERVDDVRERVMGIETELRNHRGHVEK